jgi:hypothetical protein
MQTNLAQARRNYYGGTHNNGGGGSDSDTLYYNADGSRTGARIDGRVKRKTMMGGASQGPISSRLNRSEMMAQEAAAEMDAARRRGEARAQATQAAKGASVANATTSDQGAAAPVGGGGNQATGKLIPGTAPGSSIWVKNGDPRLKKPDGSSSDASNSGPTAMMTARMVKARRDRALGRKRAELEGAGLVERRGF